jgi:hypothetical protein
MKGTKSCHIIKQADTRMAIKLAIATNKKRRKLIDDLGRLGARVASGMI